MKCENLLCQRQASMPWDGKQICQTCHRKIHYGEFGEKLNPPWTREQCYDALVNQDGLSSEEAKRKVGEHFGDEPFDEEIVLAQLSNEIRTAVGKLWPNDQDLSPVIAKLRNYADYLEKVQGKRER